MACTLDKRGLALAVVGALAGLAVGWILPRKHEATVVIQTGTRMPEISRVEGPEGDALVSAQRVPAPPEILAEPAVLGRVSDALDLPARWRTGPDRVAGRLKSMVSIRSLRGEDALEIKARHRSPVEARDVAREAALAFRERRGEHERERAKRSLSELEAAIAKQERKVKAMWVLFQGQQSRRPWPMQPQPLQEGDAGQKADTFEAYLEIARELIGVMRRIISIGRLREGASLFDRWDLAFPESEELVQALSAGLATLLDLERKRSDMRAWGAADDSQPAREADRDIACQREHNEELCEKLAEVLEPRHVELLAESDRLDAELTRRAAARPDWPDLAAEVDQMWAGSMGWYERLVNEDETLLMLRTKAEGERIQLELPPVHPVSVTPEVQTSARPVHPDPARWLILGGLGGWAAGMLVAAPWCRSRRGGGEPGC